MTGGWRNRFMAPVYALVISFVLVAILGTVLNDPMQITFTIPKGELKKQENVHVVVKTAVGGTELADERLDGSREIPLLNTDKHIAICLPREWAAEGWPNKNSGAPKYPELTCWKKPQGEHEPQD